MTLPVAVAVAVIGCVLAVSANVTSNEMHKALNQERYKRMIAEESLLNTTKQVKALEVELTDARNKISRIESVLNVGKAKASNLESQLENLMKANASLKEQVKGLQQRKSTQAP